MIALLPELEAVVTLQSSAAAKQIANSLVFAEIFVSLLGSSQEAYKTQMYVVPSLFLFL
jgi:hypothetical protein